MNKDKQEIGGKQEGKRKKWGKYTKKNLSLEFRIKSSHQSGFGLGLGSDQ